MVRLHISYNFIKDIISSVILSKTTTLHEWKLRGVQCAVTPFIENVVGILATNLNTIIEQNKNSTNNEKKDTKFIDYSTNEKIRIEKE